MLIGRGAELEYLKEYYGREGSRILIFYGQKSVGKTAILREFTRGKPCHYYMARACSEKEHLAGLEKLAEGMPELSGREGHCQEKEIIIVEEFQRMVRAGEAVTNALFSLPGRQEGGSGVLMILVSSSVSWVENSMVSKIGEAVRGISDVYKVKELEFQSLREYFPMYSVRQCIEVYAILGGIPGWWEYFDGKRSVKENVCRAILEKTGGLHQAVDYLASEELREPAVYSTILAALAAGIEKLNDLYSHTGFSRAKLSVYLNNLIGMEWVEKVFSFEPAGIGGKKGSAGSGAKKGIYRICNCYVKFYYTYLYRGESRLFRMSAERFYNTYILPDRDRYIRDSLRKICIQHMEACGRSGQLPVKADRTGSWFGKKGHIDAVVQEAGGATLLALCQGGRMGMAYREYSEMLEAAGKAGFRADYVWLYAELFDERLVWEAERKGNLTLVDIRKTVTERKANGV